MRKKLFAVIMSVMMMVTFMPTMAFAADTISYSVDFGQQITMNSKTYNVKWASDFSMAQATSTDESSVLVVETDKSYTIGSSWDGKTVVKADFDGAAATAGDVDTWYYDLSTAVISGIDGGATVPATDTFTTMQIGQSTFSNDYASTFKLNDTTVQALWVKVTLTTKKDLLTSSQTKTSADLFNAELNTSGTNELTFKATKKNYDSTNEFKNQSFTFHVNNIIANQATDYAKKVGHIYGQVPDRTITISGKKAVATNATFKVDGKIAADANGVYTVPYDGKDHEFKQVDIDGVTSTYELYDASAGAFKTVDSVKVKNADTYLVRATAKDSKDSVPFIYEIKVEAATVEAYYSAISGTMSFHEGEDVAKKDLVALYACAPTASPAVAVSKKAKLTDEDLATWNNIVEKYVEIEGIKNTVGKHDVSAVINSDLLKDEDAAIVQFLKNFNLYTYTDTPAPAFTKWTSGNYAFDGTGVLEMVEGKNIVIASNQSKTFHVKNAKALKAKKTFKLKGDSTDFGTITYVKKSGNSKIAVAKDGKVTVKKGLKKGTYKVKVYAKAAGAKDLKTVTVKIAK